MMRWSVGYILVHRSKVQILSDPMSGELELLTRQLLGICLESGHKRQQQERI